MGVIDSKGPAAIGARPSGRGRGGVLYVYIIYRGLQNGLRKARSQRRPLQITSLAKPWGEFEGGWHPDP